MSTQGTEHVVYRFFAAPAVTYHIEHSPVAGQYEVVAYTASTDTFTLIASWLSLADAKRLVRQLRQRDR